MSKKPNCDCLNECGDDLNVGSGTVEPCGFLKMKKARDEAREAALRARNAAVRTLEALGYTYVDGAEQWNPPLGQLPTILVHDSKAVRDVLAERRRQIEREGWTREHDTAHDEGQMAAAAGYYALASSFPHSRDLGRGMVPTYWPWDASWWKPTTARRNLEKSVALGLAEIERLDHAGGA